MDDFNFAMKTSKHKRTKLLPTPRPNGHAEKHLKKERWRVIERARDCVIAAENRCVCVATTTTTNQASQVCVCADHLLRNNNGVSPGVAKQKPSQVGGLVNSCENLFYAFYVCVALHLQAHLFDGHETTTTKMRTLEDELNARVRLLVRWESFSHTHSELI